MSGAWRLRGYAVGDLLGRGASGDVWHARIAATGEAVALKRLAVRDAEQARRAHAEAALLTVLDHPNLVRLHDLVPDDDVAVLVLDLADGGSLADLLATRGRLTAGEVITAVAPIAAALAYIHGQGVVHGDVSPANILFTPGGVPLLADLGVARLTGDDSDAESTPAYIDPAVAAGCVPATPTDVFMLGAVALHALTGAPPWPGPTAELALAAARLGDLGDLAGRLAYAGVPKAMAAVVGRALTVDPARRGTAADFALDLRHSGTPIAVELSAGLPRRRPPAAQNGSCVAPLDPPGTGGSMEPAGHGQTSPRRVGPVPPSRPPVGRHAASPGAPPPTRAVRRPRPVIPRQRPRRNRRRVAAVVAAVLVAVLVLGLIAGGVVRWHTTDQKRDRPPQRDRADWISTLSRLDALRAKAFATRDVGLLKRVYLPGPLLTADTALLLRLVPLGCGLVGATTRYTGARVQALTGGGATLTVLATLPPSRLECPGAAARRAYGVGPAAMRLRLVRTTAGARIAAQERAAS